MQLVDNSENIVYYIVINIKLILLLLLHHILSVDLIGSCTA
jgi:hypothetical protein